MVVPHFPCYCHWCRDFRLRVLPSAVTLVWCIVGHDHLCCVLHSGKFCCRWSVDDVLIGQLAWLYATTNVKVQIDIFCRLVAGYIWEGKVLANIWFFNLGYISGIKGLAFAQDLKLGIYCNVSPYLLFNHPRH